MKADQSPGDLSVGSGSLRPFALSAGAKRRSLPRTPIRVEELAAGGASTSRAVHATLSANGNGEREPMSSAVFASDMTNRFLRAVAGTLLAIALADLQAETIVHAGRVVDVEHGKVFTDQAIHVDNGRITKLEPFAASGASGATVVDWSKYTVVPGLIDMHTHVVDELQGSNPAAPLLYTAAQDVLRSAVRAVRRAATRHRREERA